jgi:beta-barrel assembly-enhancing protease
MRKTALMILAALTIKAQDRPTNQGVNFYSLEREAALGAGLDAEIRRQATPVDSVAARDLSNRIGNLLAAQMPSAPFPYTFTVIAADWNIATHEPIAVPGGYIFIPAQLILAARDEAEFAGMLAHAMAHVSARHYTREATRAEIANQAAIPLVPVDGRPRYGTTQASSVAISLGILSLHRGFETEADLMAVATSAAAGLDPSALVRYIGRAQAAQPGTSGKVFAMLPPPEDRVSRMETAIQALSPRAYVVPDAEEFARVQAEVRPLVALAEKPQLDRDPNPTLRPALKRPN